MLVQSFFGVPNTQSRMCPTAAFAAEAALDAPLAAIISAPRFATRGMYSALF